MLRDTSLRDPLCHYKNDSGHCTSETSESVKPQVDSQSLLLSRSLISSHHERCSIYSRKISDLASTHLPEGYQLPNLQKHLDIVFKLAGKQLNDPSQLNEDSVYSMASALCAARINTIEEANKFNLVIVPPGPIFHTWYALHKTTLFNGENYFTGFNYVQTIEEEASRLKEFGFPVIFIYSTLEMSPLQADEMSRLFALHESIVSIHLETDLSEHKITSTLAEQEDSDRLDSIRFLCLQYKDDILKIIAEKAMLSGKQWIVDSLKNQTLVYSDIDNIIFRPDLYMLSHPGAIACNNPQPILFIEHDKSVLQDQDGKNRIDRHNSYLQHVKDRISRYLECSDTAQKLNDKLHDALLSGYLVRNFSQLVPCREVPESKYWTQECGHYRLGKENSPATLNTDTPVKGHYLRKKFESLSLCRKEDRTRLTTLAGMQLLRYLHVNYHNSWYKSIEPFEVST